jgi:transcriptional regulator with XRE-family HTH domain
MAVSYREVSKLGERLKALRLESKLKVRQVAAALDMDPSILSKIENGRRTPTEEQCREFAKFYGIPFEELEEQRVTEKLIADYRDNPTFLNAIDRVKQMAPEFGNKSVSNMSGSFPSKQRTIHP